MNPDQTINLNQNAAQCLHSASYFGKEVIYNICNNTNTEIPWGGGDWALLVFLLALGTGIIILLFATVFWMIFGDS